MTSITHIQPFQSFILAICAFTITSADTLGHAQEKESFTPHHVAKLRSVLESKISPSGRQIAYVLNVPRNLRKERDGPAWTELHVVDVDGNSRPFISGQVNVRNIAWMPGGRAISFLTRRDSDKHQALYVISPFGGEARKVLEHDSAILDYSWSPDGKSVAFLALEARSDDEQWQREFGFDQEVFEEDAAFVRVWIAKLGNGKKPEMAQLDGSALDVQWSPGGDHLAVATSPEPLHYQRPTSRHIRILDAKTKKVVKKLDVPGQMSKLIWSPDGEQLAVIAGVDKDDPRPGRLWITPANGGQWRDLTPNLKGHVMKICWRRTAQRTTELAALIAKGVRTQIRSFYLKDGKTIKQSTAPAPGREWPIVHDFSVSSETPAMALVANTASHPNEIYYLGQNDNQPRRLTNHNAWLRNVRFAKQEVISYVTHNGLKLEGILIRPVNEQKGKRYPLVIDVHDGPAAHVSNGWLTGFSHLGQVGAANGMAVFYPNYRGSTGRGAKFSMLAKSDGAVRAFADLVDGVDHLVASGLVDKKRVGITGVAYGGDAAVWGATGGVNRFAAAVANAATGHGEPATTKLGNGRAIKNEWKYLIRRKPNHSVVFGNCPLLILHGKNDPLAAPNQSIKLYRHVKKQSKTPVRLVLYPGEGHGNRRAASRLDYNLRLLRWMKHYLKGQGRALPPRHIDYGPNAPTKESLADNQPGSWRRSPLRLRRDEQQLLFDRIRLGCPCCIWP